MIINVNDYNINYINKGQGDVVLLLHGWGSNLKAFTSLINLLKTKYRVLALDYPGFGESDVLRQSFCIDDYCDIVIEFLKKLKVDAVTLIGHSYGGRIILKLNNIKDRLPFKITKNVLIDAAGLKDKKNLKVKLKIFTFKTLKKVLLILPIDKNKKNVLIDKMRKKFGSSDYSSATKVMQETLIKSVNEDLSFCLENMNETLIIWGDKDIVTPMWMAKYMESKISNSGLVILSGGHFSYLDDAGTFERVIRSYFKI